MIDIIICYTYMNMDICCKKTHRLSAIKWNTLYLFDIFELKHYNTYRLPKLYIYILPYFLIFSCLLVSTILYFAVYLLVLSSLLRLIRTNTKRRKKVSKKWASLYIKWSIHVLCTLLLTLQKSFNNQSPGLKLWWTNGKSRIL